MATLEDLAAKSWFELWGLTTGMIIPTLAVLIDARSVDDYGVRNGLLPPALDYALAAIGVLLVLRVLTAMAIKLGR